jgi:glycosyltransferase involved in cell wall biosynthesis
MLANELVSIITPCYNSECWISRYLESILFQSYKKIQLIIINDGSSDRTEEIVFSYKNSLINEGIELEYLYKKNGGLGSAINDGLKLIKGNFFCWCDSDNFYDKDYILLKYKFFQEHLDISIVRCDGNIVFNENINKIINNLAKNNEDIYKSDLFYNALLVKNFHFGCAMIKTEDFDKVVKNRNIYESREGQNWQLLLPMLYHYKSGYIDKPLFYFVIRSDSISYSKRSVIEKIKQYEEYFNILNNTLKNMKISEYEKCLMLIMDKYYKQIYKYAFYYKTDKYFFQYYNKLKQLNLITKSEDKMYKIYNNKFLYKFIKLLSLLKRNKIIRKVYYIIKKKKCL